jgi:diguanylate cyclase (GGDEF)-like protein
MDVIQKAAMPKIPADDDHLFRAALDASVDGHTLWSPVLDDQGNVCDVQCFYSNRVSAMFSGRTMGDLVGSRLVESAKVAGNTQFAETLMAVVRTGKPLRHRSSLVTKEGVVVWCDFVVVRLAGGLSISGRDVTAEVRLQQKLERANVEFARLASTDSLTSLPNRRAWESAIAGHIREAKESRLALAVALIDLDRFKLYNDTRGHLAGDIHLCEVAARWRAIMPEKSTLSRIGGEEFTVALPGMDLGTARDFLIKMSRLVPHNETCSVGVTVWDQTENGSSLLGRADAALYAAKHAGRNCVEALPPPR